MEWGVLGIGIVIMLLLMKIGKKKPAPAQGGFVFPLRPERVSIPAVFFGLIKTTLVFAVYITSTLPLFANPPEVLQEWWMVAFLVDIFAFGIIFSLCVPKSYGREMDRKSKVKGSHTPFDYFVGVVLTIVFLAGIGVHMVAFGGSTVASAI